MKAFSMSWLKLHAYSKEPDVFVYKLYNFRKGRSMLRCLIKSFFIYSTVTVMHVKVIMRNGIFVVV